MSTWKTSVGESIAQQTETAYLEAKKLKEIVDVGFFLKNYVVEGGVVTKDIYRNNEINVTDIVVSIDNDVTRREGNSFTTKIANTTYYLDYKAGDFTWGTTHPIGSYLPVAQVTTDGNKNVLAITDKRGPIGGFRLLDDYMYPEIAALQVDNAQRGINLLLYEDKKVGDNWGPAIQYIIDTFRYGCVIVIPEQVFTVTTPIVLRSDTYITGVSWNSKLLFKGANITSDQVNIPTNFGFSNISLELDSDYVTGMDLIYLEGKGSQYLKNFTLEKCWLNGNQKGSSLVNISYVDGFHIQDNRGEKSGNGNGVVTLFAKNGSIKNNRFTDMGRTGIQIFNDCSNIVIDGNIIQSFMLRREVEDAAIDCYGPNNYQVVIVNNIIDTGTNSAYLTGKHSAIRVNGGRNYHIKNNTITMRSPTNGQVIRFGDRSGFTSDNILFTDNIINIESNIDYVVRIIGADNLIISNNHIDLKTGIIITSSFIETRISANSIVFSGNKVNMNNVTANFFTSFSSIVLNELLITNNVINNCTGIMVAANNSTINKCIVIGNSFKTSNANAFHVYATIAKLILSNNILQSAAASITNQANGTTVESITGNLVTA